MVKSKKKSKSVKCHGGNGTAEENLIRQRLSDWKDKIASSSELGNIDGVPDTFWDPKVDILSFPSTLLASRRSMIHNCAADLELAHYSKGFGEDRYLEISRFADAVGPLEDYRSRWFDSAVVKPVFCRGDQSWLTEEKIAAARKILAHRAGKRQIQTMNRVEEKVLALEKFYNQTGAGPSPTSKYSNTFSLAHINDLVESNVIIIQTVDVLIAAMKDISDCKIVGFDCEMHSYRSYLGMICSIQLSSLTKDYIVDTLALWEHIPEYLGGMFKDENILKIGHGLEGCDISCLYRDFGIIVINAFDTQIAHRVMSENSTVSIDQKPHEEDNDKESSEKKKKIMQSLNKNIGLATLLLLYRCPLVDEIKRSKDIMTLCDWRKRPFSPSMIRYAALDSKYLIPLFQIMSQQLISDVFCGHFNRPHPLEGLLDPEDQDYVPVSVTVPGSTTSSREFFIISPVESPTGSNVHVQPTLEDAAGEPCRASMQVPDSAGVGDDDVVSEVEEETQVMNGTISHHERSTLDLTVKSSSTSSTAPSTSSKKAKKVNGLTKLEQALFSSSSVCRKINGMKIPKFAGVKDYYNQRKKLKWLTRNNAVFVRLFYFREHMASSMDESVSYVCGARSLLKMASDLPASIGDIIALFVYDNDKQHAVAPAIWLQQVHLGVHLDKAHHELIAFVAQKEAAVKVAACNRSTKSLSDTPRFNVLSFLFGPKVDSFYQSGINWIGELFGLRTTFVTGHPSSHTTNSSNSQLSPHSAMMQCVFSAILGIGGSCFVFWWAKTLNHTKFLFSIFRKQ